MKRLAALHLISTLCPTSSISIFFFISYFLSVLSICLRGMFMKNDIVKIIRRAAKWQGQNVARRRQKGNEGQKRKASTTRMSKRFSPVMNVLINAAINGNDKKIQSSIRFRRLAWNKIYNVFYLNCLKWKRLWMCGIKKALDLNFVFWASCHSFLVSKT